MHEQLISPETRTVSKGNTLFKPASWQTQIDFINHLVLFNNILIAVLAEKEGGKTSFVHLLQNHLDSQIKSCVINAQVPCDQNTLACIIADAFHLKNDGDKPIDIVSVIRQINERKASVLLIIDNAQNLPETWIKQVLDEVQQQNENTFFHLCFVSDFSAVASYNELTKDIGQHRIHSIELGTLNENEMKIYVSHKTSINNIIYTNDQLTQLYKMTGGCLAKINNHLSVNSHTENRLVIEKKNGFMKQLYIAAAITAVAVGVSYFLSYKETNFTPSVEKPMQMVHKKPVIRLETPLVSELINWQEGSREFVYNALPEKQILAKMDGNDLEEGSSINPPVIEKAAVVPKIKIKKIINISKKVDSSYIQPIKKPITPGYTVQLLASHQLSDIHKFIAQYHLEGISTIRLAGNKNSSWYILTVGEYTTSSQANQAANQLSTQFTKYKPWVRLTSNLKVVVG